MTKFSASDVEAAIQSQLFYDDDAAEAAGDDYKYFCDDGYDELDWQYDWKNRKGETIPDLTINGETVAWSVVESDTGGEGHGEDVWIVLKVGDQLFRKEGYYASHYGTDWDGTFEEVEAYEKTVTDYRRV